MSCVLYQVVKRARVVWDESFGKPRLSGTNKRKPHLHKGVSQPLKRVATSESGWLRKRRTDIAEAASKAPKRARSEKIASTSALCPAATKRSDVKNKFVAEKRKIRKALALENGCLLADEAF